MKSLRLLFAFVLLPLTLCAVERALKVDPERSYVDVDVSVTVDSFTARLEKYDATLRLDEKGRIKQGGTFAFKFTDLKTGKPDRDRAMIDWLGGGEPSGKFDLGILAVTPSGQGQVTGNLTFHGKTSLVEFPVNVTQADGATTITGEATVDYRLWGLKVIRKGFVIKVDPLVKVRFKLTGVPVDLPSEK
ncbi:MAG TPA: YceI family protein [Lacunisphaera sp.]